jgi:hypothetical protein
MLQCRQPKIDIEHEMALAVPRAGGEVVADLLPNKNPNHLNADYLFRSDGIVAELKCLTENAVLDPDFRDKLANLYKRLMDQGRVPHVIGTERVSLKDIAERDERTAYEFLKPYKVRLGRILNKANNQIKETAQHFGISNYRGLLLLANEGDQSYEFGVLERLLWILLRDRNSSINMVLYFAENVTMNVPGFHPAARTRFPMCVPNRPVIEDAFVERLWTAWMNRVATVRGVPLIAKIVGPNDKIDMSQVTFTDAKPTKLTIPHNLR